MNPRVLPAAAVTVRACARIALLDAHPARERTPLRRQRPAVVHDAPRASAHSTRMSPRALSARVAAVATIVTVVSLAPAEARDLDLRFERNPIRSDETVRLIVESDAGTGGAQPDVEPLRRDFEILGRSTSTQITIDNGRQSALTQWVFELAPRRSGRLTAGPLRVGAMTSPAVDLEVLPAAAPDEPGGRDVFIETDLTPEEVYVQSQLTYTIRIYRAVEFLEAALSDFAPEGVVTHRLGKDATYTRAIGGRRYRVIERRFAVFPQASGRLALPALRLDARVAEADAAPAVGRLFGEGRRIRLASQPVDVVVEPRPAGAATPWLPARALTLAEEWPEDPPRLVVGEPVTWTLRLEAAGLTAEQLPPLDLPGLDSVRIYPDQPSIATRADANAVHGERVQRIAMVPGTAGELEIPELRVEWWDVEADAPRTALIPARTIPVAPAPAGRSSRPMLAAPPAAPETSPRPWPAVSAALAFAWLVTLGALLRVLGRRRPRDARPPIPAPADEPPRDIAAARRRVLDACRDASPRAARDALLFWAGLTWPEAPPRDLIALAMRTREQPLAEAILILDRALWSARDTGWSGRSLAAGLPRELGPSPARSQRAGADRLPSLHPA